MEQTLLLLPLFFTALVSFAEGNSCSGSYYEGCTQYKSTSYGEPCGFFNWGRCIKYKSESYWGSCLRYCRHASTDSWNSWGSCSRSCGSGVRTRNRLRRCNSQCSSRNYYESQQESCNTQSCPVNGGWSAYNNWSDWSLCTATCGEGLQESFRTRTCNNPRPQYNGQPCSGETKDVREQTCKLKDCPGYCECSTVGDTHYKTFDGQWIHFIGASRFQLAKSDESETDCPFSAYVINDGLLPYQRSIELTIKGTQIKLLTDKVVHVNGAKINLPYTSSDKTVKIFLAGRYVRVETECEIELEWDGKKGVELVTPDSFASRMNGICGNCDKELNELTSDNETLSQSDFAKLYSKPISGSGDAEDSGDVEITGVPEVSDDIQTIAAGDDYCGHLVSKENTTSPFKECFGTSGINAELQYDMCVQDVALHFNGNSDAIKDSVCENMATLAAQCAEKDVAVDWRKSDFCPLTCGENMVYSHHISGCQKNCVNKDSNKTCDFPFTEGCVCKEGYILGGSTCVKEDECGCDSPVGYIASGEQVMSDDCGIAYKCDSEVGYSVLETECHSEAECKLDANVRSCVCKEGFEGEGTKECKETKKDCKATTKGETYDGKISKTENGFDCQAWAVKTPHSHSYTTKLGDQSNYCRNPDNSKKPWCYTTSSSKRWDYCSIPDCEREVKECLPDAKGIEYNGHKSTTISGKTCQSWSSNSPHSHRFSSQPSIENEANYCRNFDGSKQPWCYTTDPTKRWEYCSIPPCEIKECLSGDDTKGKNYQGKITTTKNGYTCQSWSSDTPHKHNYNGLEGNYCRNPDGSKTPWCYTNDPSKRWDYCEIPMC